MTSSIVPLGPTSSLTKAGRDSRREIARIERDAIARATKVQAIAAVTHVALHEVARLSAVEGELVKAVPLAEARLASLADTATLAMADHIAKMSWL